MSEEDYIKYNKELQRKQEDNIALTPFEQNFWCRCTKFEKLTLYPFCIDEYFRVMFLQRHPKMPGELKRAKPKDNDLYKILVETWGKEVNMTKDGNCLINIVTYETRKELRALRKSIPIINNFSKDEYPDKKQALLAWTKYRYIAIKNIWIEVFHSKPYSLFLDEREIIFDEESLAHVLSGHFSQTMKQYISEKSFLQKIFPTLIFIRKLKIFLIPSITAVSIKTSQ